MTARGVVQGNRVVLEEGVSLPDGTQVEVHTLIGPKCPTPTQTEREAALKRLLAMNLPVADWEQMEQEIIEGAYGQCPPQPD